jgi:hypothetical protein
MTLILQIAAGLLLAVAIFGIIAVALDDDY